MIKLDFSQIDIEAVLKFYNIRNLYKRGDEQQFSCPFPEHNRGDRNPSASINTEKGVFHCFSCGRSGNLVTFVAELEGVSLPDAARWLRDSYGGAYRESSTLVEELEAKLAPQEKKLHQNLPEATLDLFSVDWERAYDAYRSGNLPRRLQGLFQRGLTPEILYTYNIGFDNHSYRFTIPVRSEEGDLVGFKGRATSPRDKPRYIGVGDRGEKSYYGFPTVKTSNYVYLVHLAKDNPIIVEGEFDAISLRERGFDSVALGGSNVSEQQIKILQSFEKVTLMLDPDDAGKKAERFLSKNLLYSSVVRVARLKDCDPADSTTEQIESALQQAQSALLIR